MKKIIILLCFALFVLDQRTRAFYRPDSFKAQLEAHRTNAESGDFESQFTLGLVYLLQDNYAEAGKYLKMAAKATNENMRAVLENLNSPEDYRNLKNSFENDAESGNIDLQILLGVAYFMGENFPMAERYLKPAADAGNDQAQFTLGAVYLLTGDIGSAEKYLKPNADAGNSPAQLILGGVYASRKEYTAAEKYLKPHADAGNADAQLTLGIMYEDQKKYDLAKQYMTLAKDAGHPGAEQALNDLAIRMLVKTSEASVAAEKSINNTILRYGMFALFAVVFLILRNSKQKRKFNGTHEENTQDSSEKADKNEPE
ncbi:MAG: sel1 repeat family protein [Fusobacteriaceae bacterium]|jgi:TPR repeat protein|nr:sel1 repeat family protein [Fusobacteriaceae bacterium]